MPSLFKILRKLEVPTCRDTFTCITIFLFLCSTPSGLDLFVSLPPTASGVIHIKPLRGFRKCLAYLRFYASWKSRLAGILLLVLQSSYFFVQPLRGWIYLFLYPRLRRGLFILNLFEVYASLSLRYSFV